MGNSLKHIFNPAEPPEPGYVLDDNGFRYTVRSVKPHRNQLGEPSLIITWEGICAEDGKGFECKSGAKVYNLPRRCKAHNIGWVKAYPFGAPRPENAPSASGTPPRIVIKAFVDAFLDRMDESRDIPGNAKHALETLMTNFLEEKFPGITSEPEAGDLLS